MRLEYNYLQKKFALQGQHLTQWLINNNTNKPCSVLIINNTCSYTYIHMFHGQASLWILLFKVDQFL